MGVYVPVLTSIVTLVSMFAVMWALSPLLAVLALGMAFPLALLMKFFTRPMSERRYREMELRGDVTALAEQTLSALPIVKSFTREREGAERFRNLAQRTARANVNAAFCEEQFKFSTSTVSAGATAIVMLVGGVFVLREEISVGTLIVFIAYFAALYSPMETLAYLGTGFAKARAGARRVLELLEFEDDGVRDLPGAQPLPEPADGERPGHVRFEHVTFGYQANKPVLRDVSLEAKPGERVAIVGRSGGGKSTLMSLLVRLYDPWSGRVLLDGTDIGEVTLKSLRAHISIVPQDPFLLPLTIAENIAYGRPEASRQDVVDAATAASAHAFIENLPNGYDTVIGERGCTLSGGEKQRISIARALLKDAPILILDEPTSALDAGTEAALLEAFERLMADRTTFIIAHRLSTIRHADRIVAMDHGEIVEHGTHQELLDADGYYRRLHDQQFSAPGKVVA
jgi:ATP-binding cassette subfamily B protein/subfamily B ATP-binding cassette protein MsbA